MDIQALLSFQAELHSQKITVATTVLLAFKFTFSEKTVSILQFIESTWLCGPFEIQFCCMQTEEPHFNTF